jgi:hypothetical protein
VRDIVHVEEGVTVRVMVDVRDGVLDGTAVNVLLGVRVNVWVGLAV